MGVEKMIGPEISYEQVGFGSELYKRGKDFREEILRRPLGIVFSEDDLKGEDKQFHFSAIGDNGDVFGTVVLKPAGEGVIKLRQMAVSPLTQGQGVGKKLVLMAEEFARASGYQKIEMTARVSAQGFYETLGYHTVGEEFIERAVPVPSIIMTKNL